MKKKLLVGAALSVCAATAFTHGAFAEGIATFDDLKTCVESAEKMTCEVGKDIDIEGPLSIKNDITLNLNGYNISVDDEEFPNADNGKGMFTVEHGGTFTVRGGTITTLKSEDMQTESGVELAIRMTSADIPDDEEHTKTATLYLINTTISGRDYGVSGNGNTGRGNTVVYIDNSKIYSTSTEKGNAIYQPQLGETIIDGENTVIEGACAIAIKSGNLDIRNGLIKGTGEFKNTVGYRNGALPTGAALQIESNDGYSDQMNISITGGRFESKNGYAIDEYKEKEDTEATIQSFSIKGGTFEGKAGHIRSQSNLDKFITDGVFIGNLGKLPALEKYVNPESALSYSAGKIIVSSKIAQPENLPEGAKTQIIFYDRETALEGGEESLAAKMLKEAGVTGKEVALYIDIEINGLEDNHNLDAPVTFDILVPEEFRTSADGYTRTWTVLREHLGDTPEDTTYTELPAVLNAETGELSFSSDKFSQFLVLYEDTKNIIPKAPDSGIVKEYAASSSFLSYLTFLPLAFYIIKRSHR